MSKTAKDGMILYDSSPNPHILMPPAYFSGEYLSGIRRNAVTLQHLAGNPAGDM